MDALPHSSSVPTWDERERAELIRELRLRAMRARDGYLPAHIVQHGQRWMLRPLPYPYAAA
jgi:hypothetical protein